MKNKIFQYFPNLTLLKTMKLLVLRVSGLTKKGLDGKIKI